MRYNAVSYKYKRFLFLLVKIAIVVGATYFVYIKLTSNGQISFTRFKQLFFYHIFSNKPAFILIILLTILNWSLEILKWKTLVATLYSISFWQATQQSLGALTTSLLTPNRIGEYGAKALFYKKNKRKIIFLNFLGNSSQMLITTIVGSIGLVYFILYFDIEISLHRIRRFLYLFVTVGLFIFFGSKNKRAHIGGFTLEKIKHFTKQIPFKIHFKNAIFALLRYAVFSFQFYYLLHLFGVYESPILLYAMITAMYFIASMVPSFSLFDWAIKGSVALWVFSFLSVNSIYIVSITLLMWILNFGIPSLIGSYFVLRYKKPLL